MDACIQTHTQSLWQTHTHSCVLSQRQHTVTHRSTLKRTAIHMCALTARTLMYVTDAYTFMYAVSHMCASVQCNNANTQKHKHIHTHTHVWIYSHRQFFDTTPKVPAEGRDRIYISYPLYKREIHIQIYVERERQEYRGRHTWPP